MINESDIVDFFKNGFADAQGIGDDAAVVYLDYNRSYLITKDLLIEDRHFRRSYYDPDSLAHKALHVNFSDIAAMGGVPKYVLSGIAIPHDMESDYLHNFMQAFALCCKENKVHLIGGDTVGSNHGLVISITAIGMVNNKNIKYYNTAKPRDVICVVGNIGYAHLGLMSYEKNIDIADDFRKACLKPRAMIHEGLWLGQRNEVRALTDISDGLYSDIRKITRASNVGAVVDLDKIAIDDIFKQSCDRLSLLPARVLSEGGEDYALLITVDERYCSNLCKSFFDQFGYNIQPIGHTVEDAEVLLLKMQNMILQNPKPFGHF